MNLDKVTLDLHNWACATYVLRHPNEFPKANTEAVLARVAHLDMTILHSGHVEALMVVAGRLGYDRATKTIHYDHKEIR